MYKTYLYLNKFKIVYTYQIKNGFDFFLICVSFEPVANSHPDCRH